MKRAYFIPMIAALVFALAGCDSNFDHLEMVKFGGPPVTNEITYDSVQIAEGAAILFAARPFSKDGEMSEDTEVKLESDNPAILGVAAALPDQLGTGTDPQWGFVLLGVKAGTTRMIVTIDGTEEKQIPAEVLAQ